MGIQVNSHEMDASKTITQPERRAIDNIMLSMTEEEFSKNSSDQPKPIEGCVLFCGAKKNSFIKIP